MSSDPAEHKRDLPLPGGPPAEDRLAAMIRVDHAGEYGAVRIYEGQLAILGRQRRVSATRDAIGEMAAQERRHLERFDALIAEHGVRPTALAPLWDAAGFMLGATTALMGEKTAMACTAAVEEVIETHYARQGQRLGRGDEDLAATIAEFRADEARHRHEALAAGAEEAPGYRLVSAVIKTGCRLAIKLSEKI